jgi:hypothetical protein
MKRLQQSFVKIENQLGENEPDDESVKLDIEDDTALWNETIGTESILLLRPPDMQLV